MNNKNITVNKIVEICNGKLLAGEKNIEIEYRVWFLILYTAFYNTKTLSEDAGISKESLKVLNSLKFLFAKTDEISLILSLLKL